MSGGTWWREYERREEFKRVMSEVISIIGRGAQPRSMDMSRVGEARAYLTSTYDRRILEIAKLAVDEGDDLPHVAQAKAVIRAAAKRYRRALDAEAERVASTNPDFGAFS